VATPETTILTENEQLAGINADYEQRYGFHDAEHYLYKAPKGLNREIVEKISEFKSEPTWMRGFRLKALDHFFARNQPTWGSPLLAELDYDDIRYFVRASETPSRSWDDVPGDVARHPHDESSKLIVDGFVEPIIKQLPMEYAVEMNRLIELQTEGSIG